MPRANLSLAECFSVLGVPPGAPWEQVRQAYLDLVRVWHPDRFQSTPELRDRAEKQLQKINEAYAVLKNANIPNAEPEPPPYHAPETPYSGAPNPRSHRPARNLLWLGLRLTRPMFLLGLAGVCLVPALFVWRALGFLRLTELDSTLIESRLRRPAILTPSRIVNPFADLSINSDVLAAWARGEGVDLWRSLPTIGEKSPQTMVAAPKLDPKAEPGDLAPLDVRRHQRSVALPIPVNGTEIVWTRRMSGAGELWVTNDTSFDALATLVRTRRTEPLRAIYIQAKSKVCVRNIGIGIYDLVTSVGENWDPKALRFRAQQHSLERAGPFNFFDVTSAEGNTGCRYDIVLRAR